MSTNFEQLRGIFVLRNALASPFTLEPTGTHTEMAAASELDDIDYILAGSDQEGLIGGACFLGNSDYTFRFYGTHDGALIINTFGDSKPTSFGGNLCYQPLKFSDGSATGKNLSRTQKAALSSFEGDMASLVPLDTLTYAAGGSPFDFSDFSASLPDGSVFFSLYAIARWRFTIDGSTTASYSNTTAGTGFFVSSYCNITLPYAWLEQVSIETAFATTMYITSFGVPTY